MHRVSASSRVLCGAPLFALFVIISTAAAQACTSGVLQIKEFPHAAFDTCFDGTPTKNSIKAVCLSAIRATVKNGVISLVPLETGTFNYSGPGPFIDPSIANCKDFNASGLLNARGSAATVMLLDNVGGPLSNLTRNGNQITLSPGVTYSYKAPPVPCAYNYTVVSGCVLGLKAPAKAPPCPRGFASKSGRFGIKYCAPCLQGTYAAKAGSAKCSVCPRGKASAPLGSIKCMKCEGDAYQPRRGQPFCDYCSTYDNRWTDNVATCKACPAGSFASTTKRNQCVRCYAGKKCCTVNWDKNCPKCTTNAKPTPAYTSIFALDSATPSTCLASPYALCSPKINITIDSTCIITMSPVGAPDSIANGIGCGYSATSGISGPTINPVKDFNYNWYNDSSGLPAGNATLFKSPYIDFNLPFVKCKLRYRALTSPAAKILGATPKPNPAPASSCPAGKYIATATDAKPGPCLPCPPGTYSAKAGTAGACTACAPGTYAGKFGSTRCTKCPVGLTSQKGAVRCSVCQDFNTIAIGAKCQACPANSGAFFKGIPTCLGNAYGTICCAGGDCKGQAPCSGPRTATSAPQETYGAVLQLVSTSLSGKGCRDATLLKTCLTVGDKVVVKTYSDSLNAELYPETLVCPGNKTLFQNSYYGGVAATNRAFLTGYDGLTNVAYEVRTAKGSQTVTLALVAGWDGLNYDLVTPATKATKCTATFKLLAGYLLDAAPPAGAKCPAAYSTARYNGRTLCTFCGTGSVVNSKGACKNCPGGFYNNQNAATKCKPCPVGTFCFQSSYEPTICGGGQYTTKPKAKECINCKPNTFTSGFKAVGACTACPKGTTAPAGASACGVPFLKAFA